MKIALALLLLSASSISAFGPCHMKKAPKDDTTCWGWIKGHPEVHRGIVRRVRGRIVDGNDTPLGGTLIEVFEDDPKLDLDERKRVAAYRTGPDGEFCIKGLKPGKYELRGSCAPAFDAGHTVVTLAPKDKSASEEEIIVKLNISQ